MQAVGDKLKQALHADKAEDKTVVVELDWKESMAHPDQRYSTCAYFLKGQALHALHGGMQPCCLLTENLCRCATRLWQ